MTFDGYLSQTWLAHGDGRRIVTAGQRIMLLSHVAKSVGCSSRGIVRLADRCAAVLADQVGMSWRWALGTADGPGAALSAVLVAYRDILESLELVELAEAAYLLTSEESLNVDLLVVHRFTDFTPAQENFLTRVAKGGARTVVTLTWEEGFAPTEALDDLVHRLAEEADRHKRIALVGQAETDGELAHMERELFSKVVPMEPQGAVRLSFAEGPEAEALGIAEEVRRLIVEKNVRCGDIAVVFRDCEGHAPYIRKAFADAGIPADYDVRVPFGSVPFGRAFLCLLSFATRGDRSDLLTFLRTRFSGVNGDRLSIAEATWRRHGVRSLTGLTKAASALGDSPRRKIGAALRCVGRDVTSGTVEAWHELADDLLTAGYGRGGQPLSGTYESDAWAHAAVTEVLSDTVALRGLRVAPSDVVEALMARKLAPSGVEREGRVHVTAVARIRARRFTALIVGGLNAGEFPARHDEGMLPQGEVARVLSSFGGRGQEGLGAVYERFLFYQTITRPTRCLVLSALTQDADGELAPLSPLLEEALDFYRDGDQLKIEPIRRRTVEFPQLSEAATGREGLRGLAYRGQMESSRVAAAVSRASGRTTGLSEESRCHLAGRREFSASELELYLSCPYRWFYERALSPQKLDVEFDEAQQGIFAHNVLSAFYDSFLKQTDQRRLTQSNLKAALEILAVTFDVVREDVGPAGSMSEEMARREVLRWTRRVLIEDAEILPDYAPTRFEWDFSDDPVDLGGFLLKGRVDRIDETSGRVIVTDYKRSQVYSAAEMLRYGKVQLPLYLRAVELRLGLETVGGLYRALRTTKNRGLLRANAVCGPTLVANDMLPPAEFEDRIEAAVGMARGAAEGIREGRIPRRPLVKGACEKCPAARVCGGEADDA